MKAKKRIGARKIQTILSREDGIKISEGRVYRLMKEMVLPKMSTAKPRWKTERKSDVTLKNQLKQHFNPKEPNQAWTSDFTYISIGNKRHVSLYVILNLFARKVIAWKLSDKIDTQHSQPSSTQKKAKQCLSLSF